MAMEDLKYILPEKLQLSEGRLRLVLLAVIGVLGVICLALVVVVGLHSTGVIQPAAGYGSPGGSLPIKASACLTTPCLETAARIKENLDDTVDPCEDFYQYSCGGWEARHSIPPDRGSVTVLGNMRRSNEEKLRELIQSPIQRYQAQSTERKLKEFFRICVHDYGRSKEGGQPLLDLIRSQLKGWSVLDPTGWQGAGWDLTRGMATLLGDLDVSVLFRLRVGMEYRTNKNVISVSPGGLGMYYGYYNNREEIEDAYKDYMRQVATLLLRDANITLDASEEERRIEGFVDDAFGQERHLAEMTAQAQSLAGGFRRRGGMVTLQQLETNFTQVPWRQIFQAAFEGYDIQSSTKVQVGSLPYFVLLEQLLRNETDNRDRLMNNYMVWQLARQYSPNLSWAYRHARYRYYETIYGARQFPPTWSECLRNARYMLGSAVAAEFLKKHVGIKAREEVQSMYDYVRLASADKVKAVSWMDNVTQTRAQEKLKSVLQTVGFPDTYFDQDFLDQLHSKLVINKTLGYFQNYLNAARFRRVVRVKELQAGAGSNMWSYALTGGGFGTVSYYSWSNNHFIVPAGAMQWPLYLKNSPSFFTFGGLGTNMADELSESFNALGRYLWTNGTFTDWWSANTSASYRMEKNCFVTYFDNKTVGPFLIEGVNKTVRVNGRRQAWRFVDRVAALRISLSAYRSWLQDHGGELVPAGLSLTPEQAFFVAATQTQCRKQRDEYAYQWARYNYLPTKVMVNGALSHTKEFADIFQCKPKSKMVAHDMCEVF